MSAVGYEGHIWEELFGKISFKKVVLYLILILIAIGIVVTYILLR